MAKATKKVAKKKATKKKSSRGRGRPAGSTGVLPYGTARAIKAMKKLHGYNPEALEIKEVKEAYELIYDVMRGKVTGRYIGDRIRCSTMIIEFHCGKPKLSASLDVGESLAELLANVERKG